MKSAKVINRLAGFDFGFLSLCLCLCAVNFYLPQRAQAQTGGTYDLSHSVIASGGGSNSTGGTFRVDGTIGQNLAGTVSTGGTFNLRDGFWAFDALAPTAAPASLSGRVFSGKGLGIIRRVQIVLFDASSGITQTTQTNPRGFYRFEELEVGHFYIVRAESKKFTFTPDSYSFELLEDRADVNFAGGRLF